LSSVPEKNTLYTTILSDVLTSNEWRTETKQQNEAGQEEAVFDAHYVMGSGNTKQMIDLNILRSGVEKFAKIDFGNPDDPNSVVVIKMRDPNDPILAERPQEVIYCADRPVVIAEVLSMPNTADSKKSNSGKKTTKSSTNTKVHL
jgi:hypothetical protein